MPWMGIQDLWTFLVAVLVFLALPGPGTFTLLTATARGGVRAGYATLAGLMLGDQILIAIAATGVAADVQAGAALGLRHFVQPCQFARGKAALHHEAHLVVIGGVVHQRGALFRRQLQPAPGELPDVDRQ